MIAKRILIKGATGAGVVAAAATAVALVARSAAEDEYEAAAFRTWRPIQPAAARADAASELVRCATLAANSHNTQPWRYATDGVSIAVSPDFRRRCPAVDPDDHHLFVSLGCAVENIVQAAPVFGLRATARWAEAAGAIRIDLDPSRERPGELFRAIEQRQCTRADYDGRAISTPDLALLAAAGRGSGVELLIFTDTRSLKRFLPVLVAANTAQMGNPDFLRELKHWIRFSYADAVTTRDGLFAGASGSPVVPAALGSLMFDRAFTIDGENRKYERQVRSSAGIAVFVAARNDPAHWVETGRCFQRFALQATALGVRHAMLNQPVEVASCRGDLASFAGVAGMRPDLVVRFGYGRLLPRSLRRPVNEVLA